MDSGELGDTGKTHGRWFLQGLKVAAKEEVYLECYEWNVMTEVLYGWELSNSVLAKWWSFAWFVEFSFSRLAEVESREVENYISELEDKLENLRKMKDS